MLAKEQGNFEKRRPEIWGMAMSQGRIFKTRKLFSLYLRLNRLAWYYLQKPMQVLPPASRVSYADLELV